MANTLNITNINKVIAAIKDEDNFFDMEWFTHADMPILERVAHPNIDSNAPLDHKCGTASCICGWAILIESNEAGIAPDKIENYGDTHRAAKWFGMDPNDVNISLFLPDSIGDLSDITRQEAINTLENLKKTGKVVWEFANDDLD